MRTRIQKTLDTLLMVGLLGAFPQYGQSETTPTSSNATNAVAASPERRPIEPLTDGIESTNWIASCKEGNWREIMRHPDDNVGKPFWIKGNIQQLMEPSPEGNFPHIGNILVYEDGDTLRERQWLFAYDDERTTLPSGNMLKDDEIVVFAVFKRVAEIKMNNPARLVGPKEWKEKMPLLHARLVTWETPEEVFMRYHLDNQRTATNPVQTVSTKPSPKKPTPNKPTQTTKQAIDKRTLLQRGNEPTESEKMAMGRVFYVYAKQEILMSQLASQGRNEGEAAVAQFLAALGSGGIMTEVDTDGCPQDFADAWKEFVTGAVGLKIVESGYNFMVAAVRHAQRNGQYVDWDTRKKLAEMEQKLPGARKECMEKMKSFAAVCQKYGLENLQQWSLEAYRRHEGDPNAKLFKADRNRLD